MTMMLKLGVVFFCGGFLSMFLLGPCLVLWFLFAEACRFDRAAEAAEREETEPCEKAASDVLSLSLERRVAMFVGSEFNRG